MKRIRTLAVRTALPARFLLLGSLWLALYAYAGRPLLATAAAAGLPRAAGWSVLLALALLPALPLLARRADTRKRAVLHWIGYATLGLFSLLLTLVFAGDLVRVTWFAVGALTDCAWPLLNLRAMSLGIAGTAGALTLIGLVQARCPRVRRVEVQIDDLPLELDGYRIAQWSDVHISATIQRRFLASLVERTNALEADALAITGDFVDGPVSELRQHLEPLRDLRTRDGAFYVTGNHEYYWSADEWVREIERHGVTFLKNDHRLIARGNARLAIAGVTDPVGRQSHKPDADKALAGVPASTTKVLLAHRPQASRDAERLGVQLQLSGHTHGGQFFPFNLFIKFFQPIVAGLHRVGRTWVYVSRGTGYWGPPSRLGVHGEITLLELRRSAAGGRAA